MLTSLMPDNVKRISVEEEPIANEVASTEQDLRGQQERLLIRMLKRLSIVRRHSTKEWKKIPTPPRKRLSLPSLRNGKGFETSITEENDEFFSSLSRYRRCLIVYSRRLSFDLSISGSSGRSVEKDIDILSEILESKMKRKLDYSATEMAEAVQNFYTAVEMRLHQAVSSGEWSREEGSEKMDDVENQLMTKLHRDVFETICIEECREDVALMEKINDLHWVTAEHLAAKIDESDAKVAELLDKAMIDIAEMNFRVSPIEKLECIMNCSRKIFAILKNHPQSTEGADDYLPLLVHIVLRVNPPRLHSNIRYILQFSSPSRVIKGEEGYYFTHLCSVVSYIQTVTAESLNLSQEEFDFNRSCKNQKPHPSQRSRYLSEYLCEAYNRAAERQAIGRHQDRLFEKTLNLKKQVEEMKKEVNKEKASSRDLRFDVQSPKERLQRLPFTSDGCSLGDESYIQQRKVREDGIKVFGDPRCISINPGRDKEERDEDLSDFTVIDESEIIDDHVSDSNEGNDGEIDILDYTVIDESEMRHDHVFDCEESNRQSDDSEYVIINECDTYDDNAFGCEESNEQSDDSEYIIINESDHAFDREESGRQIDDSEYIIINESDYAFDREESGRQIDDSEYIIINESDHAFDRKESGRQSDDSAYIIINESDHIFDLEESSRQSDDSEYIINEGDDSVFDSEESRQSDVSKYIIINESDMSGDRAFDWDKNDGDIKLSEYVIISLR